MYDINELVNQIEASKNLFKFYNSCDNLEDYSPAVLSVARPVEVMLQLFLQERGYYWENGLMPMDDGHGRMRPTTVFAFIRSRGAELGISKEMLNYIQIIQRTRNVAAHATASHAECVVLFEAFSVFVSWFIMNCEELRVMDAPTRSQIVNRLVATSNEFISWIYTDGKVTIEFSSSKAQEQPIHEVAELNQKMDRVLTAIEGVQSNVGRIEKKIDAMGEQLQKIYEKMTDYQTLLERQLEIAVSEDEIDRIIKAYSDEISTRLAQEVNGKLAQEEYDAEQTRIEEALGTSAWNKLDESSKEFLVTAKVTYNSYQKISGTVDYSGVCLLVTKAIEVEMSNRFCRDYMAFMKSKYPGRKNLVAHIPTVLCNKFGGPIKPKDFTLGSVIYVLGVEIDSNASADEAAKIKDCIRDFVRTKLMIGKSDAEIDTALDVIGRNVDDIRNDYRNPSAHTNQLQKINAKECFDLVLDVTKVLKTILDLLDY